MSRSVWKTAGLFAILASAAALTLLLVTRQFGLVQGEEFAPNTFERRSYWYYEIPLAGVKITPTMHKVQSQPLAKKLIEKQLVPAGDPPKRWDLVLAQRRGAHWKQGDARILSLYLDGGQTVDPSQRFQKTWTGYWDTWTDEHPPLAAVLWPEVARLARRAHYLLIPAIFETASRHDHADAFRSEICQILATGYDDLGQIAADLQRWQKALGYYELALTYQPKRSSSLEGRDTCLQQMAAHGESQAGDAMVAEQEPTDKDE